MSPPDSTPPCATRRTTLGRLGCVVLLCCLLAGCGKEYEVAPVSGRVTLDGKPMADVGVTFVPLAKDKKKPNVGPGSIGKTDAEGRFTLKTVNGEEGAVPAEHVVRMSAASPPVGGQNGDELAAPSRTSGKSPLPRNAEDGTLHFVVPPEGTDKADFELKSEPRKRSRRSR